MIFILFFILGKWNSWNFKALFFCQHGLWVWKVIYWFCNEWCRKLYRKKWLSGYFLEDFSGLCCSEITGFIFFKSRLLALLLSKTSLYHVLYLIEVLKDLIIRKAEKPKHYYSFVLILKKKRANIYQFLSLKSAFWAFRPYFLWPYDFRGLIHRSPWPYFLITVSIVIIIRLPLLTSYRSCGPILQSQLFKIAFKWLKYIRQGLEKKNQFSQSFCTFVIFSTCRYDIIE